ncbi:MAG: lysophospholipid acyltransferase family protein [Planctomycetes bacterium]|nr:lysophospholipid acyltransferase family protein [Planctomycetota bacterium]
MLKRRHTWRLLLEYTLFRGIACAIGVLPVRTAVRLAEVIAFFVHRILPKKLNRHHVAKENLQAAFGNHFCESEIDQLIYRMWVHLFRMIGEILLLPRKLKQENLPDVIRFRDNRKVVKALCSGRPVILLSGHFGNWEMAVSTFGLFGFPMGVVARDLDNSYLHDWFRRFREHTGHRLLSKNGGGGDMVEFLENRSHLALLGDQDAGSGGLFVPFFGKEASTFKSIALLAIQCRAVICVGYARRLEDDFDRYRWARFELGCEEVIDVLDYESADAIREITQTFTSALERVIRRSPEQYFWIHRRWKSKPRQRSRRHSNVA